eukprot:5352585-Prymnesium_polylepis.1
MHERDAVRTDRPVLAGRRRRDDHRARLAVQRRGSAGGGVGPAALLGRREAHLVDVAAVEEAGRRQRRGARRRARAREGRRELDVERVVDGALGGPGERQLEDAPALDGGRLRRDERGDAAHIGRREDAAQ